MYIFEEPRHPLFIYFAFSSRIPDSYILWLITGKIGRAAASFDLKIIINADVLCCRSNFISPLT